jgi:hypothetical protein
VPLLRIEAAGAQQHVALVQGIEHPGEHPLHLVVLGEGRLEGDRRRVDGIEQRHLLGQLGAAGIADQPDRAVLRPPSPGILAVGLAQPLALGGELERQMLDEVGRLAGGHQSGIAADLDRGPAGCARAVPAEQPEQEVHVAGLVAQAAGEPKAPRQHLVQVHDPLLVDAHPAAVRQGPVVPLARPVEAEVAVEQVGDVDPAREREQD